MYGYEIPVNESAYNARERYLNDKKREEEMRKIKLEYSNFIKDSRDYFLSEAINIVLQNSLDEETSEENRAYGKALVEGFVEENGSIKLLSEFSKKSLFLANMVSIVNEAHQIVLHGSKEGDSKTLRITKTVDDEFFDKLIGLQDDQITDRINKRVCDAIETFVQNNVNDKLDLEELADKTKEKIDNIKARNAEEKEKIVKEFTNQYNKAVNDIKRKANRKVGIFEQLVHSASKEIISNQNILESFIDESSGKLDMNKIVNKVKVMYTFLEMLNTTKMATVNESFLENVLKSI